MWLMAAAGYGLGVPMLLVGLVEITADRMALPAAATGVAFLTLGPYLFPPRRGRPAVSPEGLVLRCARVAPALPVVWCGWLGVAGLTMPGESGWFRALVAVILALTAFVAVRTRGRNAVVLTPEGVCLYRSGRRSSARWAEVRPYQKVESFRITTYRPYVGVGDLDVPVWLLTVGPLVAYSALHYYATHPEARAELADRRAYDRVVTRDLGG